MRCIIQQQFHNTAILSTWFGFFYQESTLVLKYFTDSISKSFCVCITCQHWFLLHVLSIPRTKGSNCITAYKGVPVAERTIVSPYSKFSSGWCLSCLKHSTTRIGKKYCWRSYLLWVRHCSKFCLHFITFGFHYFPCFLRGRYWVSAWKLWFRNGNLVQWQLKLLILNISAKEQSNKLHTQTHSAIPK